MTAAYTRTGADVDGPYRYRLWREWDREKGSVLFVMLNPSTADATHDDPTIRRCVGFARRWGYGRLDVVNLYAFRATDPADLWRQPRDVDIEGPRNDVAIGAAALEARMVVAAWGAIAGRTPAMQKAILAVTFARDLHALVLTKDESPRHPLYVRGDVVPFVWREHRCSNPEAHA